jgi:hypothetical protein
MAPETSAGKPHSWRPEPINRRALGNARRGGLPFVADPPSENAPVLATFSIHARNGRHHAARLLLGGDRRAQKRQGYGLRRVSPSICSEGRPR